MIQQVSNTRTDKQLTSLDFARIAYASCLNLFHTNTMFKPWPLGIYYAVNFCWVKRIDNNSYQFQQCWGSLSVGTSPSEMNKLCGTVVTKTYAQIQAIHPNLICTKDEEERVCIECYYRKPPSGYNKSKLGFFILEPQLKKSWDVSNNLFLYSLIITPKPGLFPGKN
ncbi:MAG: hypothetical protein IJT36_08580 [Alphaproteobacteria bacterium]|nr:hypothetical protein [Alphaproteobacteria bacterium]